MGMWAELLTSITGTWKPPFEVRNGSTACSMISCEGNGFPNTWMPHQLFLQDGSEVALVSSHVSLSWGCRGFPLVIRFGELFGLSCSPTCFSHVCQQTQQHSRTQFFVSFYTSRVRWFLVLCVCGFFFPPCYFSCHFITQSFPVALPCSSTHLYGLHLNTVTSVFLRQPPEQQVSSTHNLYSFPHEQLVCPSKGVSKYTQRLYRSSIWTEGTKKYIADKS